VAEAVYQRSQTIAAYRPADVALDRLGPSRLGAMAIRDHSDRCRRPADRQFAPSHSRPPGTRIGDFQISAAGDFAYTDPVDGSTGARQGIRIGFTNDARIVYRPSGTGIEGATLRVYLERFEPDPAQHALAASAALSRLAVVGDALADITGMTGRQEPSVAV
jgi:phosphoglucomutase